MRKDEIKEFANKLRSLESQFQVEVISDNYFTRAVIVDVQERRGFSYHYKHGNVELDTNTYLVGEDEK